MKEENCSRCGHLMAMHLGNGAVLVGPVLFDAGHCGIHLQAVQNGGPIGEEVDEDHDHGKTLAEWQIEFDNVAGARVLRDAIASACEMAEWEL